MTIFGLGNPTERYAATRHNIGFLVLDALAGRLHVRFRHAAGRLVAQKELAGKPVTLVKPLLYMNNSGMVVQEQLQNSPDDFLVVCDDLALPFGRLRLRPKGSDGGHNGLGSIIYALGRNDFPRLRVGIGQPPPDRPWIDWVLEPFSPEETAQLPAVVDRAAEACLTVVTAGLATAMNRYNAEPMPSKTKSPDRECSA